MEGIISMLVFFFVAVISNCVFNVWLKSYLLAAILSASVSTILFQLIGYFVVGYLDPFWLIALVVGWAVAFLIGIIVGLLFLHLHKKKKNSSS